MIQKAKRSAKQRKSKKPRAGIFERIKKSVAGDAAGELSEFGTNDGVDLESGTIVIDDSAPETTITTTEILRAGTASEDAAARGDEGKVFVIDLGPFFTVMGSDSKSKIGKNLVIFGENLLARIIGRNGTYTLHGQTQFLFRLSVDDVKGWKMASKIVNELGVNFLRDSFKPEEMLPEVLAMVDAKDAYNADGSINIEKSLATRTSYKPAVKVVEKEQAGPKWSYDKDVDPNEEKNNDWFYGAGVDPDAVYTPEWNADAESQRSASARVKRGNQRRKFEANVDTKKNRRHLAHGRRDSDNPNTSVW